MNACELGLLSFASRIGNLQANRTQIRKSFKFDTGASAVGWHFGDGKSRAILWQVFVLRFAFTVSKPFRRKTLQFFRGCLDCLHRLIQYQHDIQAGWPNSSTTAQAITGTLKLEKGSLEGGGVYTCTRHVVLLARSINPLFSLLEIYRI